MRAPEGFQPNKDAEIHAYAMGTALSTDEDDRANAVLIRQAVSIGPLDFVVRSCMSPVDARQAAAALMDLADKVEAREHVPG